MIEQKKFMTLNEFTIKKKSVAPINKNFNDITTV